VASDKARAYRFSSSSTLRDRVPVDYQISFSYLADAASLGDVTVWSIMPTVAAAIDIKSSRSSDTKNFTSPLHFLKAKNASG
jgi:hypothetical protein